MEITTLWKIASTDFEVESGRILRIHYTVDSTDGVASYHSYGSVTLTGGVVLPYAALTEELLISWVLNELGDVEVAAINETHLNKINIQRDINKNKYGSGLPWS